MPQVVLTVLKYLALKYAARLIIEAVIEQLEKQVVNTESKVDDDLVGIIKEEKEFIISAINKAL